MPFFKGFDRTTLHYKDVGRGKPIVFIHGNNVDSDSWEEHLTELAERGYRCLAYDKRGFGRSDLAGHGFDLDTFADDLDCFLQHLDLCEVTLVGHSIGTLEIV